ncbi:MAG: B12-binding domain-containing radical SAM protein, partial [Oscillospiraceae bacterium]|nr:B12-binding domain-containing radical SAM protein [Oscillospiraceae bacterium]
QHVRKSGLTFAPEAGTQRLRDAINKNVTEEDLLSSCAVAFSGGWNAVKLYFMLGLPTETDEDVLGIADLARKVLWTWKKTAANKSHGVRITVSTSCFVPKPHTPFQWEGQNTREEFQRKVNLLRDNLRERAISYHWHDPDTSFLEAVFARGDRRLADVIETAFHSGAKLDAWSEYFNMGLWMDAFRHCGLNPAFYANRERSTEEVLPWSVTSVGVDTAHFLREREQAMRSVITPDCRVGCAGCGADKLYTEGICDA